jgi:hypothetical protein
LKQEDDMKCFRVMNPPISLNDKVSPSGVGDSHSEVKEIRNPPYNKLVRDLFGNVITRRNHHMEDAMVGCEIGNRCIDFGSIVATLNPTTTPPNYIFWHRR